MRSSISEEYFYSLGRMLRYLLVKSGKKEIVLVIAKKFYKKKITLKL